MWWARKRSRDARNVLFDAALEFGKNWRRDVRALAEERLKNLDDGQLVALTKEIEMARSVIEQWIWDRWESLEGNWSKSEAEAAGDFIRANYPWLDERNVAHAISQGTYYAWHG